MGCVSKRRKQDGLLTPMKPYIFVDLDETLIHTYEYWQIPSGDTKRVSVQGSLYTVRMRPGAKEFLAKLREIGEVRMLTIAIYDYAIKMNEVFDLGFDIGDIWAREHVQGGYTIDLKPAERVYLFDNLPVQQNRLKVNFLSPAVTNKMPTYIQVKEYIGDESFPFDEREINRLVKKLYDLPY